MRKLLLFLMVATLALGAISCGGSGGNTSSTTTGKPKIAVLLPDVEQEWFVDVKTGMEQLAKVKNIDLTVFDSQKDPAKETTTIETLISQKVDAIVISATDPSAPISMLEQAVDKGIVVVPFNMKLKSPKLKYFVGVDNYELGKLAGSAAKEYIEKNLGGKAKIAILGRPESPAGLDRAKGFKDEVLKLPGAQVVSEQRAMYREEAMSTMESILQAHPDVNVVWCYNEGSTLGALAAIKSAGKDKTIALFGTDMSKDAGNELKAHGALKAVATQQPKEIGKQALDTALKLINKEQVPEQIMVPLELVTPDTVDQYMSK